MSGIWSVATTLAESNSPHTSYRGKKLRQSCDTIKCRDCGGKTDLTRENLKKIQMSFALCDSCLDDAINSGDRYNWRKR